MFNRVPNYSKLEWCRIEIERIRHGKETEVPKYEPLIVLYIRMALSPGALHT